MKKKFPKKVQSKVSEEASKQIQIPLSQDKQSTNQLINVLPVSESVILPIVNDLEHNSHHSEFLKQSNELSSNANSISANIQRENKEKNVILKHTELNLIGYASQLNFQNESSSFQNQNKKVIINGSDSNFGHPISINPPINAPKNGNIIKIIQRVVLLYSIKVLI